MDFLEDIDKILLKEISGKVIYVKKYKEDISPESKIDDGTQPECLKFFCEYNINGLKDGVEGVYPAIEFLEYADGFDNIIDADSILEDLDPEFRIGYRVRVFVDGSDMIHMKYTEIISTGNEAPKG